MPDREALRPWTRPEYPRRMAVGYVLSAALHAVVLMTIPGSLVEPGRGRATAPGRTALPRAFPGSDWSGIRVVELDDAPEKPPAETTPELEAPIDAAAIMRRLESRRVPAPARGPAGGGFAAGQEADSSVYVPPAPLAFRWPEYPEGAPKSKEAVTVIVRVRVTEFGTVEQVVLERPLASDILSEKALQLARGLRFRPATLSGRPVAAWFRFPVTFHP